MWHVDELDLADLEQFLFLREDLLEKVLVDHFVWRHVELEVLCEVLDEVFLRTKLADEVGCNHSPLLGPGHLNCLLLLRVHVL